MKNKAIITFKRTVSGNTQSNTIAVRGNNLIAIRVVTSGAVNPAIVKTTTVAVEQVNRVIESPRII